MMCEFIKKKREAKYMGILGYLMTGVIIFDLIGVLTAPLFIAVSLFMVF